MEQENQQKTIEKKPESSQEERASFASLAKEKEANKTNVELVRKIKEDMNGDRVMVILGSAAALISSVFLQLSFSKASYELNPLSLSFFTFWILLGGGIFLLVFGLVRLFLHKKQVLSLTKKD